ncbi:hypothetical protein BU24DRAFT_463652 [Aaosphaeria arxii CBS 175.79]|uniref:Uncharacterized protein n=1 Tax=Aaosphaeria arxii CBS 175.79 TaxID=1450172 RepID=A0A6A5XPS9_9PLEO|nr:uncharacterized protein BU24DRAFT_463652 [Aaosphaeria arxii CBS 175.79]KAF2014909.1 hypothetical protein BU24DRAFT_463652 [Aaosphaeria arxii CBS 175.79]
MAGPRIVNTPNHGVYPGERQDPLQIVIYDDAWSRSSRASARYRQTVYNVKYNGVRPFGKPRPGDIFIANCDVKQDRAHGFMLLVKGEEIVLQRYSPLETFCWARAKRSGRSGKVLCSSLSRVDFRLGQEYPCVKTKWINPHYYMEMECARQAARTLFILTMRQAQAHGLEDVYVECQSFPTVEELNTKDHLTRLVLGMNRRLRAEQDAYLRLQSMLIPGIRVQFQRAFTKLGWKIADFRLYDRFVQCVYQFLSSLHSPIPFVGQDEECVKKRFKSLWCTVVAGVNNLDYSYVVEDTAHVWNGLKILERDTDNGLPSSTFFPEKVPCNTPVEGVIEENNEESTTEDTPLPSPTSEYTSGEGADDEGED